MDGKDAIGANYFTKLSLLYVFFYLQREEEGAKLAENECRKSENALATIPKLRL